MPKQILLPALVIVMIISPLVLHADDTAAATLKKPAEATAKNTELKTAKDKASYGVGRNIGRDIMRNIAPLDLNLSAFLEGLTASLKGEKSKLTEEDLQKAFTAFKAEMQVKQAALQAKKDKEAEGMLETNKKYLAENGKKKGVTVTKSGLQYEVIKSGNGAIPTAKDSVSTHYTGKLLDGTVFDSSVKRGVPATFPVGGVIAGWTEALQLMKVGDKWKLTIPSELAYGKQGRPSIPGNAVLIFEIELLSIEKEK